LTKIRFNFYVVKHQEEGILPKSKRKREVKNELGTDISIACVHNGKIPERHAEGYFTGRE